MTWNFLSKLVWNAANIAKACEVMDSKTCLGERNAIISTQTEVVVIYSFEKLIALIGTELGFKYSLTKCPFLNLREIWFDNKCRLIEESVHKIFKKYFACT